jgi:aryl-alcohol dehydrogenase-like predicted oxidoreductase
MELRNVGASGLRVSVVGLGTNNFGRRMDLEATRAVIHAALDAGITLFDTADMYGGQGGSESQIGDILGDRRKDIVLASKFGMQMDSAGIKKGGSRKYIMESVEASLRRLKTDYLDLYQFHRPDALTPVQETLRALDDLVRQGKVRYIGCSNKPSWQVVEADWAAQSMGTAKFISCQDEYSLLNRDAEYELIPAMQHCGLGLLPYYPLASGMLTGKYRRNAEIPSDARLAAASNVRDRHMNDAQFDKLEKLEAFCATRGRSILELAFSWLACNPVVSSVIAGATKPEQIAANIKAASWKLTAEEMVQIDQLAPGPGVHTGW